MQQSSEGVSLNKRIRADAAIALAGHWPIPFFEVLLIFSAVFAILFFPEAIACLSAEFLPQPLQWIGTLAAADAAAVLLICIPACSAPFSLGLDVYFDRLALGRPADGELVISEARRHRKEARRLKHRIRRKMVLCFLPAVLPIILFAGLAAFFAEPKVCLSSLPEQITVPQALQEIGVQPLSAFFCLVVALAAFFIGIRTSVRSAVPSWLAPVLLADGKVQTAAEALQLSRRLTTPHRKILLSYSRSWIPLGVSCILILPVFFCLPRYRMGKALLCRYCLACDSRLEPPVQPEAGNDLQSV